MDVLIVYVGPLYVKHIESDSIEPVTPDKLLFGGNTLYAKNKRFYAKTEETT